MSPKRTMDRQLGSEGRATKYQRKSKKPRISDGPDKVVRITIPGGDEYRVHAHILAQHSRYFRNALNGKLGESKPLEFNLTEYATVDTLSFLVDWTYNKALLSSEKVMERLKKLHPRFFIGPFREAYETWALADYLQMPELQNGIMRHIYRNWEDCFYASFHHIALTNIKLPVESPLVKVHCAMLAAVFKKGDEDPGSDPFYGMSPEVVKTVACHLLRQDQLWDTYDLEDFLVDEE